MLAHFRSAMFVKAMMVIVAVAFVGLIVVEWGADYSGRNTGSVGDTVGIINGEEISHKTFDNILRQAYRQEREKSPDPDLGQLINQTWDQLVTQIILSQKIVEYNIAVSDKEINYFNRNQPAEGVRQQEIFQTDEVFDPVKYAQFLDSPSTYGDPQMKQFIIGAEQAARQVLLNQKLQNLVAGSVKVADSEVRDSYINSNEKVKVIYTGIESSSIPDSIVNLEDSEIQNYYDSHQDDYRQDAAIRATFISFPKTPSAEDEEDAKDEIHRILEEARSGEEFSQLAEDYSDGPTGPRGGDLGFFGKGRMVKPFEEAAFVLAPGEISEPVHTQFGWHIIKVEEKKGAADSLEIHARHILIEVRAGRNTQDSLRLRAEEFLERADETGFEQASAEYSLTPEDSGFITARGFFPVLGNRTSSMVSTFLQSNLGEISPVTETDDGLYVLCLKEKRPSGTRPLEEVRSQAVFQLKQKKKVTLASERVSTVVADIQSGKSLKEAADAHSLKSTEPQPFSRTDFVPGVGSQNAFISTAFRLGPSETSEVVTTDRGAYIVQVLEQESIDEAEYDKEKESLTLRLLDQKRNEVLSTWFNDLKENAEIVDNRHVFYSSY